MEESIYELLEMKHKPEHVEQVYTFAETLGYKNELKSLGDKFNARQLNVILYGLTKGLDVSVYAKPVYDDLQMWYIYKGLKDGFLIDIYSNPEFTAEQMQELYSGI